MAEVIGGLGGLFEGLSRGMQMLYALRQAEEDQRIKRENLKLNQETGRREQAQWDAKEADAPYLDIQSQLNKSNVTAALPDIRNAYTPPAIGDTFQPTNKFAPPPFGGDIAGSGGVHMPHFGPIQPGPQGPEAAPGSTQGIAFGHAPLGGLNTSHIAQVLERAKRQSGFQRGQDVLTGVLTAAQQKAQTTQQPVSGAFDTGKGQAELPSGFTAQPERTFQPYQYGSNQNVALQRMIQNVRARIPPAALLIYDTRGGERAAADAFPGAAADIQQLNELMQMAASQGGFPQRGGAGGASTQQQKDWDAAAQTLRTQGKTPEDVLGPRP